MTDTPIERGDTSVYCYGTLRTAVRRSEGRRHAVDDISELCGAHDTLCGKVGTHRFGEWVDDDRRNCARCVAIIARMRQTGAAA